MHVISAYLLRNYVLLLNKQLLHVSMTSYIGYIRLQIVFNRYDPTSYATIHRISNFCIPIIDDITVFMTILCSRLLLLSLDSKLFIYM